MAIIKILTKANSGTLALPPTDLVSMYLNKENDRYMGIRRIGVEFIPADDNGLCGYLIQKATLRNADEISRCPSILRGSTTYTYFLSHHYLGYAEIKDGKSSIGWYMGRDKQSHEKLSDEIDLFIQNACSMEPFKIISPAVKVLPQSIVEVLSEKSLAQEPEDPAHFKFFARNPQCVNIEFLKSSLLASLDFESEIEARIEAGLSAENL